MQTRTVGEARVDHRRRPVEAETERSDDTFDEPDDAFGVERERDRLDAAVAFDVRAARAIEHDFRDARIRKQRFERTETDDLIGELSEETLQASGSKQRFFAPEQFDEATAESL